MDKLMELIEFCRTKKVYIQTHDFPDMDAIASAFGLQRLLAYYGIPSTICYQGRIDKLSTRRMTELLDIEIVPYARIADKMQPEDPIICVDSQKRGGNITDFAGHEVACIDHHPTYTDESYLYANIRMVGSCATLIAEYYQKLGAPLDRDVATALLYGLKMDTAQFSRGVTTLDIEMFKFLFPLADTKTLTALEKNALELTDLKAIGTAIKNIEVQEKIGFASIPFECPDALIALVADFILYLQEVEVAVVYAYRAKGIKFSVRSEEPAIHAGELARLALEDIGNGGGHEEMAGGGIRGGSVRRLGADPDAAIRTLFLDALAKLVKA